MPYFENLRAKLYFEDQGKGKALLFLHGASWDMRQWKNEVDYFSSEYRVITLDARGHGKSSLPKGNVSPDIFWKDAKALLDYLNITTAIVCGLSMGGHTAMQLAINAPTRVERLILIGAPCTNSYNLYERICVPVNRICLKLMPMSWIAWSMGIALGTNPTTKEYIKEVVGSINHDDFNRVWKAVTSMESRSELSKIKCPTLILIGDHDTLTKRQQPFIHQSIKHS
ncbi:MAG: alpha/beta fold hydrolase, partial [Peptococcaceae bacterium]